MLMDKAVVSSILINIADVECNVDAEVVHDALLHLPTEKYLELYKLMNEKICSVK